MKAKNLGTRYPLWAKSLQSFMFLPETGSCYRKRGRTQGFLAVGTGQSEGGAPVSFCREPDVLSRKRARGLGCFQHHLWWLSGRELTCQCRRHRFDPCVGRNGNPLQYSYLENPMDRGAWQATVHGVSKRSDTISSLNSIVRSHCFCQEELKGKRRASSYQASAPKAEPLELDNTILPMGPQRDFLTVWSSVSLSVKYWF